MRVEILLFESFALINYYIIATAEMLNSFEIISLLANIMARELRILQKIY